jgi:hypothetical protein
LGNDTYWNLNKFPQKIQLNHKNNFKKTNYLNNKFTFELMTHVTLIYHVRKVIWFFFVCFIDVKRSQITTCPYYHQNFLMNKSATKWCVFTIFTFITTVTKTTTIVVFNNGITTFFLQCYYVNYIFIILLQFMFEDVLHLTIIFKIMLHLCLSISIKWHEMFFQHKTSEV